jgi:hypothetical protein
VKIAIDFDGTVVEQDHDYVDMNAPLKFCAGAREGLAALKRAGHWLLLWSGRATQRHQPGVGQALDVARYSQMVAFVQQHLPGVFDAIDDGRRGKPPCDLFLDDKALRVGYGYPALSWAEVAQQYGQLGGGAPLPVLAHPADDASPPLYLTLLESWRRPTTLANYVELWMSGAGPVIRVIDERVGPEHTLVIVAGQHGDEQAGPIMLGQYLDKLLTFARSRDVRLIIYPCVSPDAYESGTRYTGGRRTNAFLEYVLPDGSVVGELTPGQAYVEAREVKSNKQSPETALFVQDLKRLLLPGGFGLLDLHQDGMLSRGRCFAYVFGKRQPYEHVMRTVGSWYEQRKTKPLSLERLRNESWTKVQLRTDVNGLAEFDDGSAPAWAWTRGAGLACCLEATTDPPVREAVDESFHWAMSMIELVAKGVTAR